MNPSLLLPARFPRSGPSSCPPVLVPARLRVKNVIRCGDLRHRGCRRPWLRSECRVGPRREQHERLVAGADDPASTGGGSAGPPAVRARGTVFAGLTLAARACKGVSAGPRFRARAFCVHARRPTLAERPAASPPSGGARPPPLDGGRAGGRPLDWSCKPVPRHLVVAPAAGGGSSDPPLSAPPRPSRTPPSTSEAPPHGWAIRLTGGLSCPCRLDKTADAAKVEGAIGAASRIHADRRGGWGTAGRLATRPRSRYASLLMTPAGVVPSRPCLFTRNLRMTLWLPGNGAAPGGHAQPPHAWCWPW